jgi:hypothetical protein
MRSTIAAKTLGERPVTIAALLTLVCACGARSEIETTSLPHGPCRPGDASVRLAAGEPRPYAIAVDDDGVYFSTQFDPSFYPNYPQPAVKYVRKTGGATSVVAQTFQGVLALAVDAHNVYFADDSGSCLCPDDPGFSFFAVPKRGGPAIEFPPSGQLYPPTQMVLDETHVYWVLDQASAGPRGVWRAPKAGGPTEPIVPGVDPNDLTADLTTDLTHKIWANGLAVDASRVYWSEILAGVRSAPKAGGTPTDLVPGASLTAFDAIAFDAGELYFAGWVDNLPGPHESGFVNLVSAGGGMPASISTTDLWPDGHLALSADSVYLTAVDESSLQGSYPTRGALLRAPRTGGSAEVVVEGPFVRGVTVDADCVYWTEGDGSVWRAPL